MSGVIEATGLTKKYGDLVAVDHVDLTVQAGSFFGVLGPNGAGKTTLLEMIEGLRKPDAGTATILGEPSWPRNAHLLPQLGVQLQASAFFERLTAKEQLTTFADLYGVRHSRVDEMLELVGLTEPAGSDGVAADAQTITRTGNFGNDVMVRHLSLIHI